MSEKLISADALLEAGRNTSEFQQHLADEYDLECLIMGAPDVDAVEVSTIRDWLYEIAGNNISTEKERQFSVLCEELISRLDGLRNFARERRKENAVD